MTEDPIFLDHNATTPLLPEVIEAMLPFLHSHFGNPSSAHVFGQRARVAIERARSQVAKLIECDNGEIVFTSGGTESNNLAIRGVAAARERRGVVTTVIEHPATERPCAWLERNGWRLTRVAVDGEGRALVEVARGAIDERTSLVTVMHSNNETGVVQPIAEIAELARAAGAIMHTDAAQSVGKVLLRVRELGVDLLSIAGHKLYAPKGVGALYVKRGTPLEPFALGAEHEGGLRPGTENVASIVGLGAACDVATRDLDAVSSRMHTLREMAWHRPAAKVPGIALNGHRELRLPNTLNIRFPGVSGTALLAATPEVAASTGSACHDGRESASPVVAAMGVRVDEATGSVRLSLGRGTTAEEIERAVEALVASWQRLSR